MKRWMNLFFCYGGRLVPLWLLPRTALVSRPWKTCRRLLWKKSRRAALFRWTSMIISPTWLVCKTTGWFMCKTGRLLPRIPLRGENIVAGEKVTTAQPQGKVVVKSGANVTMKASGTTTLEAGFECEKGGVLEIAPL